MKGYILIAGVALLSLKAWADPAIPELLQQIQSEAQKGPSVQTACPEDKNSKVSPACKDLFQASCFDSDGNFSKDLYDEKEGANNIFTDIVKQLDILAVKKSDISLIDFLKGKTKAASIEVNWEKVDNYVDLLGNDSDTSEIQERLPQTKKWSELFSSMQVPTISADKTVLNEQENKLLNEQWEKSLPEIKVFSPFIWQYYKENIHSFYPDLIARMTDKKIPLTDRQKQLLKTRAENVYKGRESAETFFGDMQKYFPEYRFSSERSYTAQEKIEILSNLKSSASNLQSRTNDAFKSILRTEFKKRLNCKEGMEIAKEAHYPSVIHKDLSKRIDDFKPRLISYLEKNIKAKMTPQDWTQVKDKIIKVPFVRPNTLPREAFGADGRVHFEDLENLYEKGKISEQDLGFYSAFNSRFGMTGNASELNAYYTPDIFTGKVKTSKESLNLLPAYYEMNKEKGWVTPLTTMAHEIAHAFDPNVSIMNGYGSLASACQSWSDCMKKTWGMKDPMVGESFADYVSAEVLAEMIKEAPAKEQKQLVIDSVKDFCVFYKGRGDNMHSVDDPHPGDVDRVNAIYLSNPLYRKILGCEEKGPYPYCPLKGGN